MIYVTNDDKPGFIGRFAGLLGEAGVNIATFARGRAGEGREDPGREAGQGAEVLSRVGIVAKGAGVGDDRA
jgi:D-3-phosphoglycerate dehydrogenase